MCPHAYYAEMKGTVEANNAYCEEKVSELTDKLANVEELAVFEREKAISESAKMCIKVREDLGALAEAVIPVEGEHTDCMPASVNRVWHGHSKLARYNQVCVHV